MSSRHLGSEFDIHGGGKDLIFPHHENEIAQSEAFSGGNFVRYWIHNGFVNVDREKMSKSLGNFFTIRDILEKYDAEAVRYFLLSTHYRSPIDFSDRNLENANRALDRFYNLMSDLEKTIAGGGEETEEGVPESPLGDSVHTLTARFREAMDDDFNTAEGLGEIFKTVRLIGGALARGEEGIYGPLRRFRQTIGEIGEVLGILNSLPEEWKRRRRELEEKSTVEIDTSWIEGKIAERSRAREEKEWARADEIRQELLDRGVLLEDGAEGTQWRLQKH